MKETASTRKGQKFAHKEGRKGDSTSPSKPSRRQTRLRDPNPAHNDAGDGETSNSEAFDGSEGEDANDSEGESEGEENEDDNARDSDDLEFVEPTEVISNYPLMLSNEKFEKLLYELMDQRGTPILKTPVLGNSSRSSPFMFRFHSSLIALLPSLQNL